MSPLMVRPTDANIDGQSYPPWTMHAQLAELWPDGFMDNHGIKRAICRAKDRKKRASVGIRGVAAAWSLQQGCGSFGVFLAGVGGGSLGVAAALGS
ncbi:Ubinuclein-2 [Camellia lanceoleosa]|uniref:Ubinuclein-2 n=1 Tax=Camellia lanceoleosa TaxID=1840588 RepID=A0ACC0HNB6_9ERIC|nr:Ubinuclein-2 [Camellia lanceoleosa]